jgi:hypothetical protein
MNGGNALLALTNDEKRHEPVPRQSLGVEAFEGDKRKKD